MAQQKLDLQLRGLYTSPNNLSGVPQGALAVADNVVINNKNIVSSRRGQKQYGDLLSIGPGQVNKIFNYASSLITSYDNKLAYDSGSGNWVNYSGTYIDPAPGYKMRSLEALRNFYFTTNNGVYKLDAITSTPRRSGVPKALGGNYSLSGMSGFLEDETAVAYRLVWGYIDINNNLILGSPSQRLVAINASGDPKDVQSIWSIPDGITTEYFYQLYRSNATETAADTPSDELQLVEQGNPTSTDITNGYVTILDQTPYSLMRATLYTSPSQEGIENANEEPPLSHDMDIFKGSAFYVNTIQRQRLFLSLISVGSPSLGYLEEAAVATTSGDPNLTGISDTTNLRIGMRAVGTGIPSNARIREITSGTTVMLDQDCTATDTVSVEFQDYVYISGTYLFASSTQDPQIREFEVVTSGTPAQNITDTAVNLVETINRGASDFNAYYLSGPEDIPGQILIEAVVMGQDAFFVSSSAPTSFSPTLPTHQFISNISVSNPAVITSFEPHGLTTGDHVHIFDTDPVVNPNIDQEWAVTVLSPTTFSIPIEVNSVIESAGFFIKDDDAVVSESEVRQNRAYISKPGQVEAVPSYSFVDIGSANFPIQRVVALRDGIFFFKPDGIYRLSGETFSSFTVNLVDNTVTLKAPESAVPFNNQVFCATTQGICAVTDSGVQIMSVPIEDTLLEISSEQFEFFSSASFGVAYESARQYLFFTVTRETDEFATQAFVYNSLTDSWTRWVMNRTCGVVNTSVNKLFMAETDSGQVLIERKSYTNADFADEEYTVNITAVTSDTEITVDSIANITEGMTIAQGSRRAIIMEIDGLDLTISAVTGLEVDPATVYTPIENLLEWAPIDVENPGVLKQFSEISLFFRNAAFTEIDARFSSNISSSPELVAIINQNLEGWGSGPWGRFPWGGVLGGEAVLRTYVPREKQRGHWLKLTLKTEEAFTGFSLQGVSIFFNLMSSRFKS